MQPSWAHAKAMDAGEGEERIRALESRLALREQDPRLSKKLLGKRVLLTGGGSGIGACGSVKVLVALVPLPPPTS